MTKPWTTESSRVVHADRWVDLRAQRVVTGGGTVLDPFYLLSYTDWAVAVAVTADDRLVMVRQYRHGVATTALELPGGCVDPEDASPADAARRELLEETGYGGDTVEYLGRYAANPTLQNNYLQVALIRNAVILADPALEPGEELAVELVPVSEVLDLAASGGIVQSMHVAALFMAMRALGRISY